MCKAPPYRDIIHIHIHIHINIHIHIHIHIHLHLHRHIHTYIHTYIHRHIHTYIHTYIHIYIYMCVVCQIIVSHAPQLFHRVVGCSCFCYENRGERVNINFKLCMVMMSLRAKRGEERVNVVFFHLWPEQAEGASTNRSTRFTQSSTPYTARVLQPTWLGHSRSERRVPGNHRTKFWIPWKPHSMTPESKLTGHLKQESNDKSLLNDPFCSIAIASFTSDVEINGSNSINTSS